jgi:hypothetical protein
MLTTIHPQSAAGSKKAPAGDGEYNPAIKEAVEAVNQVSQGREEVELSPQSAYIRRLQHLIAEQADLSSRSTGKEPHRRVRIFR